MTTKYLILIVPLSEKDGSGFAGIVPDLPGCMSDGETYEDALKNTLDAVDEWLDAFSETNPGEQPPAPGSKAKEFREGLQAEREKMAETIRELLAVDEDYAERFAELVGLFNDLSERIEHIESWSRFDGLVGGGRLPSRLPGKSGPFRAIQ